MGLFTDQQYFGNRLLYLIRTPILLAPCERHSRHRVRSGDRVKLLLSELNNPNLVFRAKKWLQLADLADQQRVRQEPFVVPGEVKTQNLDIGSRARFDELVGEERFTTPSDPENRGVI